jgi:hypothetical protein
MSANPFRLAMSPLTRKVFAGRIRQRDGYAEAVGVRHDVTGDFYACLIQMAESHDGEFVIHANGSPAFTVSVRKVEAAAPFQRAEVDAPERCESGSPECGPVEYHDSEGVPLCAACWQSLLDDATTQPEDAE